MKRIYKFFIIITLSLVNCFSGFAQTDTVFWFAVPYATPAHDGGGANYYADLTITAKDAQYDTYIKISQPGDIPQTNFLLPIYDTIRPVFNATTNPTPSLTTNIHIPRALLTQISNNVNNSISNSAILIQSNRKINAYYEYHRTNNNPDIFVLKGDNALGTDFWVPFQTLWNNSTTRNPPAVSKIVIVATKDNTRITVNFKKDAEGYPAGLYPDVVTLDAGETYMFVPAPYPNYAGADRLAGTHITSNKPIAVTIGDDSVIKGGPNDYVGDQLVPLTNLNGKNIIGYEYIVMKGQLSNTNSGENVFVLTTKANTTIQYKRETDAGLIPLPLIPNAGTQTTININSNDYVYISASEPVVVLHVTGFGGEMGGAIVPTIDGCTGSKDVSFVRSKDQNYYLNIMTHKAAIDSFYLSTDNDTLKSIFSASDFEEVGIGDFYVLKQGPNNLTDSVSRFPDGKPLRLVNTVDVFHLGTINGVPGGGGCAYGYFSDYIELDVEGRILQSNTPIITACYGDDLQFEVTSGHNSYAWSPIDYLDDPTVHNPKIILPPVGIHSYEVRVLGDCGLDTTLKGFQIEINPAVEAKFNISPSAIGCAPYIVSIGNVSTNANVFKWDFENDRNFDSNDTSQVFTHPYENNFLPYKDTVYETRLVALNDSTGCGDQYTRYIRVHPEITAGFSPDKIIDCNPSTIQFTDASSGNLDTYVWKFGDGDESYTTGTVSHDFVHYDVNNTIDYDVELSVTSPYFCRDTFETTVSIYPYLESEFTVDKDEGCSPFNAVFTNVSSGEDSVSLVYGDTDVYNGSSFNSLTHQYINNTNAVIERYVELRVYNDENCERIWYDTITVYPRVQAAFSVDTGRVCNSGAIEFTRTSPLGPIGSDIASELIWTFGDGTSSDTTAAVFNKTYNNISSSDKTYTAQLIAKSKYDCADTASRTIVAYRALANYVLDTDEGCSPLDVNITNTIKGNDAEIDYLWEFDNGDADVTIRQPANPITYNNTGSAVTTNNLSLTVQSNDGLCISNKTEVITTYPEIHIDNITVSDLDVCDSTIVTLDADILNALLPNVSYSWDFDDGSSSSTDPTNHLFRNIGSTTFIDRNVQLDVETEYGCTDVSNVNVRVRPLVKALFTLDTVQGCSPVTVDAIATQYLGIPAANYVWDFGDPPGYTGYNPSSHTYPVTPPGLNDTYALRLDVSDQSGLCTDFMEKQITVFAEAYADFEPQSGVYDNCNPFAIKFINNSLNATSYLWDFKDGTTSILESPKRTLTNTTDAIKPYDVELTAITADGCVDDTSITFNVYRNVKADFSVNITSGCSSLPVEITNNSKGGTYRWYWNSQTAAGTADYSSSNGNEVFSHTYINTTGSDITNYLTLIAENTDGCSDTLTKAIVVHSSIIAQFSFSQPDSCNQSDVVFTNTSTGGSSYTMSWNFGDATTLVTTSDTVPKKYVNNLPDDHDFLVTMTAESENGCTDQYQDYVTVYSRLNANFSIPLKVSCPPFENAVIENTSIGNNSNTYEWFVEGVSETTVTGKSPFIRTYTNSNPSRKDYQIRLLASNSHGCTSEKIDTISVYERVIARFDMGADQGCTPLSINFDNQSQTTTNTTYLWNFGDGASSTEFEPALGHSFYNTSREFDKPYTISLQVTSENYCSHDTTADILVHHQPLAKFFIDKTSSCPPLVSGLDKTESLGEDSWEWRFGDGSAINTTNETLTHTYQSTGTGVVDSYNLELWVGTAEGCIDSTSLTVNVFPSVTADFNFLPDSNYCSPALVHFKDSSSNWVTNYNWKFGDGNESNLFKPDNRYDNTGITDKTYRVYLKVSSEYNCWDTITKPVTVYVQPNAEFTVDNLLLKFPESTVTFTNLTNFGPFEYEWYSENIRGVDFTSTDIDPDPFTYDRWGDKFIELTVTSQTNSNCWDYDSVTVKILPPDVKADFITDINSGCVNKGGIDGLDILFTAGQSPFEEEYDYTWDFGDNTDKESGRIVTHTFDSAGVYNVQLTARSQELGGVDYAYQTITVYPKPKAEFEVSPKLAMLDASTLEARVKFYNMSTCNDTSGCAYFWDFGDGETANSRDVTHGYTELGKYDISLLVTTANGCRDSLILYNEVEIIGAGDIAFPNAFTPNEDGLNDTFKPVSEGVIQYEMLVYNRWGELIFTTKDLSVGWNGLINGQNAKPDVYVWKAQGKFTNGRSFELAGDVTLIR